MSSNAQTTININFTLDEINNQITQNEAMMEALKGEATGCGDFVRISEIVHIVEPLESATNKMKTAVVMSGGVSLDKLELVTPKPANDK